MRPLAPASIAVLALLLVGCGNDPYSPQSRARQLSKRVTLESTSFRAAGMRIGMPSQAELRRRELPGVYRFTLPSGSFGASWAYRRREPLPRRGPDLRAARSRLTAAVRGRDPNSKLRSARVTRVAGAPAIELVLDQTLSQARLHTRSVHVFKGRVEYVLEFFARPAEYAVSDRGVFAPMLRSLKVTGKLRRTRH